MHIEHFGCSHLLPPLGHVRLGFDERINLLIGPNASGKTTILRAIHGLHMSGTPTSPYAYIEASEDWPRHDKHDPDSAIWDRVPLLYIPATRIHPGGHHVFDPTSSDWSLLRPRRHLRAYSTQTQVSSKTNTWNLRFTTFEGWGRVLITNSSKSDGPLSLGMLVPSTYVPR